MALGSWLRFLHKPEAAPVPRVGAAKEPSGGSLLELFHEAERRARRAEAELRSALGGLDCGVVLLDAQNRVRFVNARFAQLMELEPVRLGECADLESLVAALQDRFREPRRFAQRWWELSSQDDSARDEMELLRPMRRLERIARPVRDGEGTRIGRLEIYREIANPRVAESLPQTEKMAALGQLVSGIAHELNNPLTAILGYAQLLLGRRGTREQRADAQKIYQEAERARRIVKNLLLFARETKPERKPVDLNEIIERTLALRSYELKVENIVVEFDPDPQLSPVLADAGQLQQVVLNLVVNAEQALLQGRGHGRIRIRTWCVSASRVGFEVADDGPGIPREIASRIFEPFFTTKSPGEGTGLGLSIVYGIVREHGGEISLESQPGMGSRFLVELPVARVAAEEEELREEEATVVSRRKRGRRILVVEDEAVVAQLLGDVLREEGHQVDVVLDSQEGLGRVTRDEYDLILCDLKMPRLDGRAFHQALVRTQSPMQHRVLFVTGDTLARHTLEFLEQKGLPYLTKPFLVEELKLVVNQMLDSDRGGPAEAHSSRHEGVRRR